MLEAGRAKLNKILSTVLVKFEGLTKRGIKEAILATTTQSRVGNMSNQKFKQMVTVNGLKNSPVRPEHIINASNFLGPSVTGLEGKTVRRTSTRVHTDRGREFQTNITACTIL